MTFSLNGTTGITDINSINLRGRAIASRKINHNTVANQLTLDGYLKFNTGTPFAADETLRYRAAANRFFWDNRASFIRNSYLGPYPGDAAFFNGGTSFRSVATVTYSPTFSNSGLFDDYVDSNFITNVSQIDGRATLIAFGGGPAFTSSNLTNTPSSVNDGGFLSVYSANNLAVIRKTLAAGQTEVTGSSATFTRTNNTNDAFPGMFILPYGLNNVSVLFNPAGGALTYSTTIPAAGIMLLVAYSATSLGTFNVGTNSTLTSPEVIQMNFVGAPASVFYFSVIVNRSAQPQPVGWTTGVQDTYGNYAGAQWPFNTNHILVTMT